MVSWIGQDVVKFGVRVMFQHVDIENTPVSSEQGSCRYSVCVCANVPILCLGAGDLRSSRLLALHHQRDHPPGPKLAFFITFPPIFILK